MKLSASHKHVSAGVHPKTLFRMRLVELLNKIGEYRLSVVSAPFGFGKTTLLGQWAHQTPFDVAWLNLDSADNDPNRFFAQLISALQIIDPKIGKEVFNLLHSPERPTMEKLLDRVVDDISLSMKSFVLVLEDYHHIHASPVHSIMSYLLQKLSGDAHVLLTSQTDPPFPLAEMRSQGTLQEIRKPHMAFTMEEAEAYYNDALKIKIAYGDITALMVKTSANPTAIKYAGLCMAHFSDFSKFVSEFEEDERDPVVFLTEILLNKQSQEHRNFLLKVLLLSDLHLSLVENITGNMESKSNLSTLADNGIFIQENDERYRFEPVMQNILMANFSTFTEAEIKSTHKKIANWYDENRIIDKTFYHAIQSGDFALAGKVVETSALLMLQKGYLVTVNAWLHALPEELFASRPMLSVCHAWLAIISQNPDEAKKHITNAKSALEIHFDEETEKHIAAISGYLAEAPEK